VQALSTQRSLTVQALVSVQSASDAQQPGMDALTQPCSRSQLSAVQGLWSSQSRLEPALQAPPSHASTPLQTLPSAQEMPLTTGVLTQPDMGLHESVVQTLLSSQPSGSLMHEPAAQRSLIVQALTSAQSASLLQQAGIGWLRQPSSASQVSIVQPLLSSQSRLIPGVQLPAEQVSLPLQTLPSEHDRPSG